MRYEISIPPEVNTEEEFTVIIKQGYLSCVAKVICDETSEFSELQTRITQLENYNSLGAENWREMVEEKKEFTPRHGGFLKEKVYIGATEEELKKFAEPKLLTYEEWNDELNELLNRRPPFTFSRVTS